MTCEVQINRVLGIRIACQLEHFVLMSGSCIRLVAGRVNAVAGAVRNEVVAQNDLTLTICNVGVAMKQSLVVSFVLTLNEILIRSGFCAVVDVRQSLQAGIANDSACHLADNRVAAIGVCSVDALDPGRAVQINVVAIGRVFGSDRERAISRIVDRVQVLGVDSRSNRSRHFV